MKIRTQLWVLAVAAVIGMAAIAGSALYALRGELLADRQSKTQNLVEVAYSVLTRYHGLETSGALSRDEAQKQALAAIKALRYNEKDYFWVNDLHPRMVMHPMVPSLDGKDLTDYVDPNGKKLFVAFVEVVKSRGQGFVDYMWQKGDDSSRQYAKLSFVKGFTPWGWIVGSGIYIDDIDTIFRERAILLVGVGLGFVILFFAVGTAIGRGVTRPLAQMVSVMDRLAHGEPADIAGIERKDEIGDMARALSAIYQTGIDAQRIEVALDTATACVMVADPHGSIIYANAAVEAMFRDAADGIRLEIPRFDPSELLGLPLSRLRKDGWPADFGSSQRWQTALGGHSFAVVATPVRNGKGERLGTVLEWTDVTAELRIQAEVDGIVSGALAGDLSRRIDLTDKTGFMLKLSQSMNRLLQVTSGAIQDVSRMLQLLAEGDLSRRITNDYAGTFEQLKVDANRTADTLAATARSISDTSAQVNAAAMEIAQGSTNLSQRTEQQASNLEETASAMEELASTVRQNAENAQQANQLASRARTVADQGGTVATQAVSAMGKIEESSQKISDIIGVIDEIAFQTNLLALNAAVEAARAGDAGKGFAVVATEVRALAQRSSEASKQIKLLIGESSREVKSGVTLVNEAGKALGDIVTSIKRVADIVSEIAAASAEQAVGLDEVNAAVAQMDENTQKNAALVEQSAASANALQELADDLQHTVGFFKLDGAEAAKPATKPVAKPALRRPEPKPKEEKPKALPSPAKPARSFVKPTAQPKPAAEDDDWEEF
jgi:methyl-accepting chemotaxis protein